MGRISLKDWYFAELVSNSQNRDYKQHDQYKVGTIFNITKSKLKAAARSACVQTSTLPNSGIDSYADPGGGEPPPTPTSPVCDSAFSEHHGCWPCEHREYSDCEATHHSQRSSGRSSPRWDDDDEEDRPHHILTQGLGVVSSLLTRNLLST